jgi:alkyl sulfatase BDS1-like metallo-beta-lactamase superfamily hydrolase
VFAEPDNKAARALGADALEQMGYQAESATWRNAYLLGARELRRGLAAGAARPQGDMVRALSLDLFFDLLGVRLNGQKAEGRTIVLNWVFPDTGGRYALTLQNCALTYLADRQAEGADATVTLDRASLDRIVLRELALADAMADGAVQVAGNVAKVAELFGLLDDFTTAFEVVEPLRPR